MHVCGMNKQMCGYMVEGQPVNKPSSVSPAPQFKGMCGLELQGWLTDWTLNLWDKTNVKAEF